MLEEEKLRLRNYNITEFHTQCHEWYTNLCAPANRCIAKYIITLRVHAAGKSAYKIWVIISNSWKQKKHSDNFHFLSLCERKLENYFVDSWNNWQITYLKWAPTPQKKMQKIGMNVLIVSRWVIYFHLNTDLCIATPFGATCQQL